MKKYFVFLCFILITPLAFSQNKGSLSIVINNNDVVKQGIINISDRNYKIHILAWDLENEINEPCSFTMQDLKALHSNLQLGKIGSMVGCGLEKPEIVQLSNGINALQTYHVTAFAIDVIEFARILQFYSNNYYYQVTVSAREYTDMIIEDMDEYFVKGEGDWMQWASFEASQELVEKWDNDDCSSYLSEANTAFNSVITNIQLKSLEGKVNMPRVRIREYPNLESNTPGHLKTNEKVKIYDYTSTTMRIGDMDSVWYYIETSQGIQGWAYGHFIDIQ